MKKQKYPNPQKWDAGSSSQRARAARSFDELKQRNVPVYPGPLMTNDDDDDVQSPQDVARRTLILIAVAMRAEEVPKEVAHEFLERLELWPHVSPKENAFLQDDNPDPNVCQQLVWRLESIWVLMWALGKIPKLDWPAGMCDVPHLVGLADPMQVTAEFIESAQLRPKTELFDAQDLTMRLQWAIRDAYLNHGAEIPSGLDWSGKAKKVSVHASPEVGVVEQRHYSLNWLTQYPTPEEWDDVDTPT